MAIELWPLQATACNPGGTPLICQVSSGDYYILRSSQANPLKRDAAVLILHDAGRDGTEILNNKPLVDGILARGYTVIIPLATKRKYVRYSIETKDLRVGKFTTQRGGRKSDRKYVLQTPDGKLRPLKQGSDRGWYFANTDVEVERNAGGSFGKEEKTPKGRDEASFLGDVLFDAAQRFWVDPDKVTILGLGHGATLAWQLACKSPQIATLFAPVNGAFWMEPPETCDPGGNVIHTHQKNSTFWPMDGTKDTPRRFGQVGVLETAQAFAATQACRLDPTQEASDQLSVTWHTWRDCAAGTMQLNVLNSEFAFQDWWLEAILKASRAPSAADPPAKSPGRVKPRFMKPKNVSKT